MSSPVVKRNLTAGVSLFYKANFEIEVRGLKMIK
jgi:hypothetical protein